MAFRFAGLGDREASLAMRSLEGMLSTEITGALAAQQGRASLVCTVYFAYRDGDIWFTSQESTRHIVALRDNPGTAFALWRRPVHWGAALFGVQLSCQSSEVTTEEEARLGLHVLQERFPGIGQALPDVAAVYGPGRRTCLIRLKITGGTLIDETNLGKRRFLEFEWV